MLVERSSSSFMSSSMEISLCSFATSSSPTALLSSLLAADTCKAAVSLGTAGHAGWKAAVWRKRVGCGRAALVEMRAAERGAVRARFRRASMVESLWGAWRWMVGRCRRDAGVVNFSSGSGSQVPIHRDGDHRRRCSCSSSAVKLQLALVQMQRLAETSWPLNSSSPTAFAIRLVAKPTTPSYVTARS